MAPQGPKQAAPGIDVLRIGADEDQLAMALPARLETMRRYVGAAPRAAGQIYGLLAYPRDAIASQGHYDPHLELFARLEAGQVASVIICDAEGGLPQAACRDEFVFLQAHITLTFPGRLLADWKAMEVRSKELLASFVDTK